MDTVQHSRIADFIWGIADDGLSNISNRGMGRNVILLKLRGTVERLGQVLPKSEGNS